MRFLLLAILLGFPLLEFAVLVRLAESHGWWVLAWLVLAACAGVALLKECANEHGRTHRQGVSQETTPLRRRQAGSELWGGLRRAARAEPPISQLALLRGAITLA